MTTTTTPSADSLDRPTSRPRSILTIVLVALTVIALVVSVVAVWVRQTVFETDRFMEIVEPTITSEEVSAAVSTFVADEVILALDLEKRLTNRLGAVDEFVGESVSGLDLGPAVTRALSSTDVPLFTALAVPIAAAIEDVIREGIDEFVESDLYQRVLPSAVATAHSALVTLLRTDVDTLENVSVVDGELRWNLVPLITRVVNEVVLEILDGLGIDLETVETLAESETAQNAIDQVATTLDAELPSDWGQVTIVGADELSAWQDTVRTLDRLVWLLVGVSMLLAAAAIWSSGRRRRTIIQLAFGSVFGLMLVVFAQQAATDVLRDAAGDPVLGNAVGAFLDQVGASLRVITLAIVAVTAVVGLTALVASRPGWLGSAGGGGRFDESIQDHPDAWRVVAYVTALLAWFLLGFSVWSLVLVAAALGGFLGYIALVRRRRLEPHEETAESVG